MPGIHKDPLFGARLRELRERAGLSKNQLAERADLERHTVSGYERGVSEPRLASVQAIAGALDVPFESLKAEYRNAGRGHWCLPEPFTVPAPTNGNGTIPPRSGEPATPNGTANKRRRGRQAGSVIPKVKARHEEIVEVARQGRYPSIAKLASSFRADQSLVSKVLKNAGITSSDLKKLYQKSVNLNPSLD